MMKTLTSIGLLIGLSLISCTKYESPFSKYVSPFDETTTTTVMGTFEDLERNRPVPDLKLYVVRAYSCGDFSGGLCSEVMDSTVTDSQGSYTITFPMRTLGSGYSIVHSALKNCGELYTSEELDPEPFVRGQTNIRNFDVWCPLVLKLELQLRNNENPPLHIYSYTGDPETPNFPDVDLEQRETDTIVYLYTKPNSMTNLEFQYILADPNENYHFTNEWFAVGVQDTLELSRAVDCSEF